MFREIPYALPFISEEAREAMEKDIFYSRKVGRYNKGDRKLWKKFDRAIPLWSGLNKNAEEAIKWFDLTQ